MKTLERQKVRQEKKEANRLIAYYYESQGIRWTSVREVLPKLAQECEIPLDRREPMLLGVLNVLKARGIEAPKGYRPPWERGQTAPMFSRQPSKYQAFYDSWEWKQVRYLILKKRGRICECCGAAAATGARIVVDHIKPVRKFWDLRFDERNLQILCDDCNRGKSVDDQTDWRPAVGEFSNNSGTEIEPSR